MEELVLGARLEEMGRLPAWVDALAAQLGIAEDVKFAINLCLEEAISNVIRHAHVGVRVHFSSPLEFVVEDEGPRFNPLELEPGAQGPKELGGQGIRLLREFADSLEYEETATGNRLRIGFVDGNQQKQISTG